MADLDKLFEIEKPAPAAKPQPVVEVDPRSAASRTIVPVPPLLNRPAPAAFITHRSIQSRTKRTIDIVGSLVGLTITAVLFVPIVIAIKLDSPGPVFFGQVRCSRMSRRFKMWKFRSMVIDAEQKSTWCKTKPVVRFSKPPTIPGSLALVDSPQNQPG
jgi:hypothetical protein